MIEIEGDLFEQKCDAICIPVNRTVKKDGSAVMSAGVAKQAVERFPALDLHWGHLLEHYNEPGFERLFRTYLESDDYAIVFFPTKDDWKKKSTLQLLVRSAERLVNLAATEPWERICLPRVGAGLGGLHWENEVRPNLQRILVDDRFVVVHRG